MARCPFCDRVLDDAWVKKAGATLMGRASGASKARTNSKAAADKRWADFESEKTEELLAKGRKLLSEVKKKTRKPSL
jgi:hypothetical protein